MVNGEKRDRVRWFDSLDRQSAAGAPVLGHDAPKGPAFTIHYSQFAPSPESVLGVAEGFSLTPGPYDPTGYSVVPSAFRLLPTTAFCPLVPFPYPAKTATVGKTFASMGL
jgi:hypothetical protein